MSQLSGRLKEILREYGVDPDVRRPEIDAVHALESSGRAEEAHAIFERVRRETAELALAEAARALRAFAWLDGMPDASPEGLTLREVDRLLRDLEKGLAHARSIQESLAEARVAFASLRERVAEADFARFERVAWSDLPTRAGEAESLRRRVAREARIEARYQDLRRRAAKLDPSRESVPDASSRATPDPADADRLLDDAEARVAAAERVDALHARVARELRDPAAREWRAESARTLRKRAEDAAAARDEAALAALGEEAARLREDAAAKARDAAKARKSGRGAPEKERRRGDPQDMYG